jgi:hypothetical protein
MNLPRLLENGEYIRKILPMTRVLATVILLISVAMFGALGYVTILMARGLEVSTRTWLFPLTILAAGAVLMWMLTRKQIPMPLYLSTFSLWLLTTGYYFIHLATFLPR